MRERLEAMQLACARCGAVLPPMEGEPANFCWQCGLPQLRVSEPVLEAAEARGRNAGKAGVTAGTGDHTPPFGPADLDWHAMLPILLVATVFGLLPCLVLRDVLFAGAVAIPVLFLLSVLCLASGFAYLRRRPARAMGAGTGAQMGLALGTMLALAVTSITAVAAFSLRYGRHNPELQQKFDSIMQQAEAQVRVSQPNAPEGLLRAMQSPEWHAGWFLTMEGGLMLLLIVGGCVAGLVTGALLRARQDPA